VQTGRVGFIKQFKRTDNPHLKDFGFLQKHHYIQISKIDAIKELIRAWE
jgi:hypothetical protein